MARPINPYFADPHLYAVLCEAVSDLRINIALDRITERARDEMLWRALYGR